MLSDRLGLQWRICKGAKQMTTSTGENGEQTESGGGGQAGSQPPSSNLPPYALRFDVDYPDRELDRLSSALRIFWVIPIAIVLWAISPYASQSGAWTGAAIIFLAPVLMIVFRQKYPRWWWDFNVQLLKFQARVGMYFALTTDVYPATDEEQSVHLEVDYPDVEKDLNRWLPLVKWLLAIPHVIVLILLGIAAVFVLIYVWVMILVNGRYPRGAFDFIVGVNRWAYRVQAYAILLATDEYPPFRLD